jgi:hypothetical protein
MPATPTLVQTLSSFVNESEEGFTGNPFHISFPNTTLVGNLLIMEVSADFVTGRTITIADDASGGSNTWTLAKSVNTPSGTGGTITSIYYVPNSKPCKQITITFDKAVFDGHFSLAEFYNVAMSSPVRTTNGSSTGTTTISSGAVVPTAGDLIYMCMIDSAGQNANRNVTQITKSTGFTFMTCGIQWGYCTQYQISTGSVSVNPTIAVGGSGDTFNCITVVFIPATTSSGTAPPSSGIRVLGIQHELMSAGANPTTFMRWPTRGNLLVLSTTFQPSAQNVSAVTTSPALTWTKAPDPSGTGAYGQYWYAANVTTATDTMTITPTLPSGYFLSFIMYDIIGAQTSPYDSVAGIPQSQTTISTSQGTHSFTGFPTITPSTANGLIIAQATNGTGPTTSLDSPNATSSGAATFVTTTYGGQTDVDVMDNSDGNGFYYNPTANVAVPFNWTNTYQANITPTSDGINSSAIAFKAAVGSPATVPPTLPSNFAGTPASSASITLTWTGSTDTGTGQQGLSPSQILYPIEISGGTFSTFTQLGTVPVGVTTFTVTGLAALTTYNFRMRSEDTTSPPNISAYVSIAAAVTTPSAPNSTPVQPTITSVTAASSTSLTVVWPDTTDTGFPATQLTYNLQRSTTQAGTYATVTGGSAIPGTGTGLTFTDTGLSPSTTYWYRVSATNPIPNTSPFSTSVSGTTTNTPPQFVQGATGSTTATNTLTVPFTAAQTIGDLNVIVIATASTAAITITSLTDQAGHTYTLQAGPTTVGTLTQWMYTSPI